MRIFNIIQAVLALIVSAATALNALEATRHRIPVRLLPNITATPDSSSLSPRSPVSELDPKTLIPKSPDHKRPPTSETIRNTKHREYCSLSLDTKYVCRKLREYIMSCHNKTVVQSDVHCSQASAEFLLYSLIATDPCASVTPEPEGLLKFEICSKWFYQSNVCRQRHVDVKKQCAEHHILFLLVGWDKFLQENPEKS